MLPGGIRQIIALTASVLHDPEIIFLDEPTAGTSPQTRKAFWALIRRLSAKGKTVFVTTHYMDEAEYCSRIVLMERGHILSAGTPENLKKKYFPQKPAELIFTKGNQQEVASEIRSLGFGSVSVFGSRLRVYIKDEKAFRDYCLEHNSGFTVRAVEPTLDDVFLKAISGAE